MAHVTPIAAKVGSVSATLTQLLTPGEGGCLYSMYHALNMEYQNIGVLEHSLTGLCNAVGNLEQNMNYLYQYYTYHSIKDSSTIAPRNDFDVQFSTLAAEFDGMRKLTEGGGFNTVVGDFKSLNYVTFWVRANIPSDVPKYEHFVDLDILLEVI